MFPHVQALQNSIRSHNVQKTSARLGLFRNVTLNLWKDEPSLSESLLEEPLTNELHQIMALERSIYEVPFSTSDEVKKEMPLSEIDGMLKSVNWTRYLLSTAPEDVHEYILSDPMVVVPGMDYLRKIDSIINDTPSRVLTNYVMLRYANSWAEVLDDKYRYAVEMFLEGVSPDVEMPDRKAFCRELTVRKFKGPVVAMYERSKGTRKMKAFVEDMIENILVVFNSSIHENSRMKKSTKQKLYKKISSMQKEVVFDEYLTNAYLDNKYTDIEDIMDLPFLEFLDAIGHLETIETFRNLLRKAPDPRSLPTPSIDINVNYDNKLNRITVPMSFIHFPRFDTWFPRSYLYGSVGVAVAHEIINGFYNEENNVDEEVQSRQMQSKDEKAFDQSSICVMGKFEKTLDPDTNMTMDGFLTLSRNLADFEGVKHAFEAYKYSKHFTSRCATSLLKDLKMLNEDQLFFVGFATPFCVKMTLSESQEQILTSQYAPNHHRYVDPPTLRKVSSQPF
ncbi:hypothetical protein GCK32_006008 [Trichostrongylus colubriformis]|uniref:Uncharacterized protein n=1 Tax=Trichostrongylus colubriformis TaxID=6319 RepID=A0AAN8IJB0_TRICO